MTYRLTHATHYEYNGPVSLSHHLARLRPRDLPWQRCTSHHLSVQPLPAGVFEHTDFYGNRVAFLTVEGTHSRLSIKAVSEVSRLQPPVPDLSETPAWESVRDFFKGEQTGRWLEASDFIHDSPLVRTNRAIADFADPSFSAGRPVLQAVQDLSARVHGGFKFDPQATTVSTPLEQFFQNRRGVCQDFAHLMIAALRCCGVPARYVSGYLETRPPPGKPRLEGADASHAWVSFFIPGIGWIDIDPTNNLLPGESHVTVAMGRDYSDVSPIRGVIIGNGEHQLKVAVDMMPITPVPAIAPAAPSAAEEKLRQ